MTELVRRQYHVKICCHDFNGNYYIEDLLKMIRSRIQDTNIDLPSSDLTIQATSPHKEKGTWSLPFPSGKMQASAPFSKRTEELTLLFKIETKKELSKSEISEIASQIKPAILSSLDHTHHRIHLTETVLFSSFEFSDRETCDSAANTRPFPQKTRSLCPVCRQNLPALRVQKEDGIYLTKTCPSHGSFETKIWGNRIDFQTWCIHTKELNAADALSCPQNCGICGEHEQGTCCALIEVTSRCNLNCRFCFAHGGESTAQPSLEELKARIRMIAKTCQKPLLQLSGGEPTLRDDLPELIRFAKEEGCPYVQLNSNGIRLGQDLSYVQSLADAGLSFVFMQFDGVTDDVYRFLRGKPLLETKKQAIQNCNACNIGVTLVPTVVKGINDQQLGEIARFGASLSPAVRGVHYQPVSYFGRIPDEPSNQDRYTLDELLSDLLDQTGLQIENFIQSRCDHPLCGFHGSFLANNGILKPLKVQNDSSSCQTTCTSTTAKQNREYVARHWLRQEPSASPAASDEIPDMDSFLSIMKERSFTLTSMAFQDIYNLDLERLHRCSLHAYDDRDHKMKPFCARYI